MGSLAQASPSAILILEFSLESLSLPFIGLGCTLSDRHERR